ncbi:MAG: hypothetical protein J0H73_08725 [Salana multivorans]|nr:hypothetical protein [Salana multivorans]OJX96900.1 MAG: hypothetical protein BGO96_02135 [Micrococcales bacterium 73-15]
MPAAGAGRWAGPPAGDGGNLPVLGCVDHGMPSFLARPPATRSAAPANRVSARLGAVLAGTAVALTLGGCAIGDAVGEKVSSEADKAVTAATCAVVTPLPDGIANQVDAAVKEIEADPAAARAALEDARAAVVGAAATGGEGVGGLVAPIESAIDELIALAEKAEAGTAVDDADRTGAAQAVSSALDGLVTACA